ncbi:L,D-transpeptidase catalytic domain protein, partial [Klebsiella oxytoca]
MRRPQVVKRNGGTAGTGRAGALGVLRVRPLPGDATRGTLIAGGSVIPCALGRSGITSRKREGDGASPRGVFR